jgi:hypothetical protein
MSQVSVAHENCCKPVLTIESIIRRKRQDSATGIIVGDIPFNLN